MHRRQTALNKIEEQLSQNLAAARMYEKLNAIIMDPTDIQKEDAALPNYPRR